MRILVTGHKGYIGCRLVPLLVAAGHEVAGVDSDLYRACTFGDGAVPEGGAATDIRDLSPAAFEGIDAVIHLAGLSNDPLGDLDPALTEEINFRATVRLAQRAKAAGVRRFVFSSSCSNYGAAGQDWLTEDSPVNPITPYAVSKVRAEEALSKLADAAFSPVYLRSGTAYGMSPRIRFDLVVNNLTAWAIATGMVRLKSDGSAWRPLVHAEDMAQAFLCAVAAERDLVHDTAFNVGRNEDCLQIRDVARMVQEAIPEAEITFADGHGADRRTYRVDCTRIRRLGYVPRWTVAEGIAELRDAFRAGEVDEADFEGARYQRVAHIRALLGRGELGPDLRRPAGRQVA
jgi:nucleoside-diphosphate-sugar epimerase